MKAKKYLLLALAALLMAACGDDDDDPAPQKPNNNQTEQNDSNQGGKDQSGKNDSINNQQSTVDFKDYAQLIGMSYSSVIRQYPNPSMSLENFLSYEISDGKTAMLTIMTNPENQEVCTVIQTLEDGAYTTNQILAYFDKKGLVKQKPQTQTYEDEDEGTITKTTYFYANNSDSTKITLLISISDGSITYINPQNMPEEIEEGGFDDLDPEEALSLFLGANVDDLMDQYENALMEISGILMGSVVDGSMLMGFSLNQTDGVVTSITFLYNEDLTDDQVIEYYKEAGYTVSENGKNDDEINQYIFTNADKGIVINYCDLVGTAQKR